jgi:hypothetical protein
MKQILAFLLLALIAHGATAQITRGTVLLNGTVKVQKSGDVEPGEYWFDSDIGRDFVFINIKAGYFAGKNVVLGGEYSRTLYWGNLSLFGRYYFKGKVVTGAAYNFRGAAVLEGGYAFFVAPPVAFEATINYQKAFYYPLEDGIGLNFSVSFFLNRRIKKQ